MSRYPENYIVNVEQHTAEWLRLRCGSVTASRVRDVVTKRKRGDGELAARTNYRLDILAEWLTGITVSHYVSPEMDEGYRNEKFARAAYAMNSGSEVDLIGYVKHPHIGHAGCSPDCLVNKDGLAEFKCPKTKTHLGYMAADEIPELYEPQMMWQMACSGRSWCDFVSYDPRLPDHMSVFTKRLWRDDKRIAEMEEMVIDFLAETVALFEQVSKRKIDSYTPPVIVIEEEEIEDSGLPRAEIPQWQEIKQ